MIQNSNDDDNNRNNNNNNKNDNTTRMIRVKGGIVKKIKRYRTR